MDWLFAFTLLVTSLAMFFVCRIDAKGARATFFPTYVMATLFIQFVVCPFAIYFFNAGINPVFPPGKLDYQSILFASLVIATFFVGFLGGSVLGAKRTPGRFIQVNPRARGAWISFVLLLISVVCFVLFVYLYGGIDYVLINASRIRSGLDENKSYLGAFFKLFTYYIEFVLFFSYGKFLHENSKKWLIIFVVIGVLCIAKSAADAGRGGLLNILIGLIFVSIFFGVRLPLAKVLFSVAAGLFVVLYGKTFIFQIYSGAIFSNVSSQSSFADGLSNFLVEFSHPFLSVVLAIDNGLIGERWFLDLFVWVLKPLRLLGVEAPDSISYYNTFLFSGEWASEIPPGIVAFAYHEGGIFFVPVFGVLMGFVLSRANRVIKRTVELSSNQKPFAVAICSVIGIYLPFLFANADPALFIQWVLAYILLFAVFRAFRIVRFPRYRPR